MAIVKSTQSTKLLTGLSGGEKSWKRHSPRNGLLRYTNVKDKKKWLLNRLIRRKL